MRIVHLGKYYPPASGGIENHTQALARAQADLGADVTVVVVNHRDAKGHDATFRPSTRTPTVVERDGAVRIHRIGRAANVARLDVVPGLARLLRRLRRRRPDIWHLHAPNPAMLLALASNADLRPLVVTHHSDVVRQRVLRHALRPLERTVYGRASAIIASSAAYADASVALRSERAKVTVVPFGIDLSPFLAAPRTTADGARASDLGPRWLFVGRLIYYKALDVALRALRDVPGRLVVVGAGPMEASWRRLAQELGVADRVEWRGVTPSPELVDLYHAATALWFPSDARSEAFGLVQVEAMAAGCPVINTRIEGSGVSWVSRHDESGLTVPVDDAPAFAAAAIRLAGDPGLRERLSRGARAAASERFDHRAMARRVLSVYDGVIGARRAPRRSASTFERTISWAS